MHKKLSSEKHVVIRQKTYASATRLYNNHAPTACTKPKRAKSYDGHASNEIMHRAHMLQSTLFLILRNAYFQNHFEWVLKHLILYLTLKTNLCEIFFLSQWVWYIVVY